MLCYTWEKYLENLTSSSLSIAVKDSASAKLSTAIAKKTFSSISDIL